MYEIIIKQKSPLFLDIRGLTRDFLHAYATCHSEEVFGQLSRKVWHITQEVSERHPSTLKEKMTLQEYRLLSKKGLIPHCSILPLANKKIHTSHHKKYGLAHFEVLSPRTLIYYFYKIKMPCAFCTQGTKIR